MSCFPISVSSMQPLVGEIQKGYNATVGKVKYLFNHDLFQGCAGFLIGWNCADLPSKLAYRISPFTTLPPGLVESYKVTSLAGKLVLAPKTYFSLLISEIFITGFLHSQIRALSNKCYIEFGMEPNKADITARITAIVLSASISPISTTVFFPIQILTGGVAFRRYLYLSLFIDQIVLSSARECTGNMALPVGLHMGSGFYNFAWQIGLI